MRPAKGERRRGKFLRKNLETMMTATRKLLACLLGASRRRENPANGRDRDGGGGGGGRNQMPDASVVYRR